MTDKPASLDLDAIAARANAATPGPWGIYQYGADGSVTDIAAEVHRLRAETGHDTEDPAALTRAVAALEAHLEGFFQEWPEERQNSPWVQGWKDAVAELRRLAVEAGE